MQGDKTHIRYSQVNLFSKKIGSHRAQISLFQGDHPAVLSEFFRKLIRTHINGKNFLRTVLEQTVRKSAGRGSAVCTDQAMGIHPEFSKRFFQFQAATAYIWQHISLYFDLRTFLAWNRWFVFLLSGDENIAGVTVPKFEELKFKDVEYDVDDYPLWVDTALVKLREIARLDALVSTLRKQEALLEKELRSTSQRVNLFEKVKIPEAKENIRVIGVYLGDQQTAAVVRGKISKKKLVEAAQ